MKRIGALMVMLACVILAGAQGLTWSIDYNTIFDNRECDYDYSANGTIFVSRLSPEVGLSFLGGAHRIAGGVSWVQPVGNGWNDYKLCPTLYYRCEGKAWRTSFGMFPRSQFISPLPKYLLSDSIAYHEPNVRGLLVQYVKPKGYAELSLDWRSLQSEVNREAFNVNLNTQWKPVGVLLAGGHAQLNHLAKQKPAPVGQGVNDDLMINPYVGVDLSGKIFLDSLVVKGGALISMQRDRKAGSWQNGAGFLLNVVAEKKFIGVEETFYVGKNVMPLYPYYRTLLNMGDPYFQAPLYSRTDVNIYFVRNRYVNLEASLVFHCTEKAFGFWQQLKLRVFVDEKTWTKRNEKATRAEWLRNVY